jgi:hypothetical protein
MWASSENGQLVYPPDIDAKICAAIDAAGRCFLAWPDVTRKGVRARWERILGVWSHEPGSPDEARAEVENARALMAGAGLPQRPVVTVLSPHNAADSRYAGIGDLLAPELYLDEPSATYDRQLEATSRRIAEILSALRPSPLIVIVQSFDRADADWVDRPWALEAIQQAANEAIVQPRIAGLWWFAYARPGGVTTYPKLEAWHAAQVAVTPPPPNPVDPVDPPDPEEPPPMDIRLVGPPQDQTQKSLVALREFCQTYEFPAGTKPYKNDTIQSKFTLADGTQMEGLYCSDGLNFFMQETWDPIMMDPDDISGWDNKRARADAALQDYMRRRLGDTGPSHAGTLAGPISRSGREFTA